MTHRFPIKEIAAQANLGTATVDRVLNNRAHVSAQTRLRVTTAIAELEAQEMQLAARGRRLFFDFVIEAPQRFSREVQHAAETALPQIGTAVCRPRFLMQEIMSETEVTAALDRILKRGSHGVCLKARDSAPIRQAIDRLAEAGIPVVTLVTDVTDCARVAYVGLDNAGAGRTAAYLLARTVPNGGHILATRSHDLFAGEQERETAFRMALAELRPDFELIAIQGGSGVSYETRKLLADRLTKTERLAAVYSMGGGNLSILDTLDHLGIPHGIYIAHDLDRDNRQLLSRGRLDFVLHHDLDADVRRAFQAFVEFHRLAAPSGKQPMSDVQIITPANIPTPRGGRG